MPTSGSRGGASCHRSIGAWSAGVCRRLGGSRVLLVGDSVLQQVGELYHDCYTIARLWLQVFYSLALTLGAAQGMKVRHSPVIGVHNDATPTPNQDPLPPQSLFRSSLSCCRVLFSYQR